MTIFLLMLLIGIDGVLLWAVYFLNTRRNEDVAVIRELSEERQMLSELRRTVQEELEVASSKNRQVADRVALLAAEAEHEVKSGGATIANELEGIVGQLSARFEAPLIELSKRQSALDNLLRKVDREKQILQKTVARGEKICKFFDERVPYQEVLHEIEDKKYVDARQMLAQGQKPDVVAAELGMNASVVRLLAGLAG